MKRSLEEVILKSNIRARRSRRLGAAVAALLTVGALGSGPARAADAAGKLSIPIGSGKRQPIPLPAGDKIELTLEDALGFALHNALDLDVAALTYERAGFGLGAASGIFDPNLQANASARKSETPVTSSFQSQKTQTQSLSLGFGGLLSPGTTYSLGWTNQRTDSPTFSTIPGYVQVNPIFGSGLTLSATQPLLRNFGSKVTKRLIVQSQIARDQSAWGFVTSVQQTIQSVEDAYWDLAYAQDNLKAKQEALDRARDFNRITKIKIDVGALAPIEIVQTEVTIAQREQDIILAEAAIGTAQDILKRLMGVSDAADWNRPIIPLDKPKDEIVTLDVEKGVETALQTRPEIMQAMGDVESRKVDVVYTKNQLLPQLDLSGSYGYQGVGFANDQIRPGSTYSDAYYQIRGGDYPNWSVGLFFTMPIGNRVAKNNAAMASTGLELAQTGLALLKQNLAVEVRNAARNVDTAQRSVAAARKSRELAERNLDAERKKFDNGMTTAFQVAQVQNDLTTARSNELQATAGWLKALVAWHKATGDLLQVKGVELTGLPVRLASGPAVEATAK